MSQEVRHVYQVYIRTTAETLWDAITNPEVTENYFFGGRFESDWRAGSPLVLRDPSDNEIMLDNTVIAADKPHKIVHTFKPGGATSEPSRVTWEIKPVGEVCLLEVTHEFDDANSPDVAGTQNGWPIVLSGLKTYLETGARLNVPMPSAAGA
ncbi:MAG TPA: SRPBCC family protein [Candidatus Baltobacteraceae bacterium]|jgi:uncharacterized protein YndB with AHSA1/START domain